MGAAKSKPRRSRSGSGSSLDLNSTETSKSKYSFQQGLVREREGRRREGFQDIYEVLHEIGQGGLCKIYKIEKKGEKIGGSSRPFNVQNKGIFGAFPAMTPPSSSPKRPKPIVCPITGDFVPMSVSGQQPMYFALKVFNLVMLNEDKIASLRNEVEILKTLDHKNIIKAFEAFTARKTRKVGVVDGDESMSRWCRFANLARLCLDS